MYFLLVLIITLLLVILFTVRGYGEGFQNAQQPLDPNFLQAYNSFITIYNPFCTNWQTAIASSVASEIPQQPLTSPSQVGTGAPQFSDAQMNAYISQLSLQLMQPLPQICTPLPSQIDSTALPSLLQQIPSDSQPYISALNWMNTKLSAAHANLGSALQGIPPTTTTAEAFTEAFTEAFADSCHDISKCIADNPDLIAQLQQQLQQQTAQNISAQEQELMSRMAAITSNSELTQAASLNTELVQKSQDIQNQAQSGQLLNQVSTPSSAITYTLPPGSDALTKMKQNNPEKYSKYQQSYGPLFSLKQLLDQINSNL